MTCCGSKEDVEDIPLRKCTDVIWLCIFIAFWFLMILVAAFAYVYGNPLRLINGYDSFGNTCGTSSNDKIGNLVLSGLDTSDKPYVLYMDMRNVQTSLKLCVKQCPDSFMTEFKDVRDFYNRTGSLLCMYDFNLYNEEWQDEKKVAVIQSDMGPCPKLPIYESFPVLNHCVPHPMNGSTSQIYNLYSVLNRLDIIEQVLGDLYAAWHEILGLTFLAFVLSLALVAVLQFFTSSVSKIFMVTVCVATVVGDAVLWWTFTDIKYELDNTPDDQLLDEAINNECALLVCACIATVVTVVILLLVTAVWKSAGDAAEVFEESAECLSALPGLFLQPVITFIALLIFFTFWVSVVVCLATACYPGSEPIHPFMSAAVVGPETGPTFPISADLHVLNNISLAGIKRFTFIEYVEPSWVYYMWWLYVIGLIWTSEFILSCQQMLIADTVSHWIFHKRTSLMSSTSRLMCYHLGSVAKGSILITLFKIPRLVLTYVGRKLSKHESDGSQCAAVSKRGCFCCLFSLENFIKYINHNAYTVTAMEGYSFCPAAKIAFNTLVNNALDSITLNCVGDFLLFLGKCFVTSTTGLVGLLLMRHSPHLHFYTAPTLVVCVFAYFIAHSVLSLYEMTIDTTFLCICEGRKLYGTDWRGPRRKSEGSELEHMND